MATNPYKKQNRYRKAVEIVNLVDGMRMSIEEISNLTTEERTRLAEIANVRRPSEETWETVRNLYEMRKSDPLVERAMMPRVGSKSIEMLLSLPMHCSVTV